MSQLTVPRVLVGLVDDAGLFPPTSLPMADAVERHRADLRGASPMLTHRFLCPASRLAELRASLTDGDVVDVGVIADTGLPGVGAAVAEVTADGRLSLGSVDVAVADVEQAAGAVTRLSALPAGTSAWIEPSRGPEWLDVIGVLRGSRIGAKLRCGGVTPAAFPSVDEVASFIRRCVGDGIRFKATAGLHRAVRGMDDRDGVVHHGFLNLLVATARAAAGAASADVVDAVACTDGDDLTAAVASLSEAAGARTRESFACYGSCSTAEPLAEAASLGLVE